MKAKTQFVVMKMRQQLNLVGDLSIKIRDNTIDAVKFIWNLGFFMDSEMKNRTHLNKLTSSLYVILKNIARIRPLLDRETTKILVQTLVLSKNGLLQYLTIRNCRLQNQQASKVAKKIWDIESFLATQIWPSKWVYERPALVKNQTVHPVQNCSF